MRRRAAGEEDHAECGPESGSCAHAPTIAMVAIVSRLDAVPEAQLELCNHLPRRPRTSPLYRHLPTTSIPSAGGLPRQQGVQSLSTVSCRDPSHFCLRLGRVWLAHPDL